MDQSKAPLVSIITIVYNNVQHIERTILSVLGQSFKNFEYLIIDGGSTDGTLEIIRKYQDRIDYFVSEKDKGIYDAMNKGLKAAKGQFVWFMNSGDSVNETTTLEKLFSHGSDGDVYYGETYLVNETGEVLGTRTDKTTRKLPKNLKAGDMMYGMVVCHQSILVRKSIAPEYNTEYRCSADIDWVITSLKRSKKTVNGKIVLSKYLIGGFSIANQKKAWKERFEIYKLQYGWLGALWAHMIILPRALYYKVAGKDNY